MPRPDNQPHEHLLTVIVTIRPDRLMVAQATARNGDSSAERRMLSSTHTPSLDDVRGLMNDTVDDLASKWRTEHTISVADKQLQRVLLDLASGDYELMAHERGVYRLTHRQSMVRSHTFSREVFGLMAARGWIAPHSLGGSSWDLTDAGRQEAARLSALDG